MSPIGWDILIFVGWLAGITVVLMVMVIAVALLDYARRLKAPDDAGECSMKTDDAPECLHIVFEDGCFVGAFRSSREAYEHAAMRRAHSERNGKGWEHSIGVYGLRAITRVSRGKAAK